MVWQYYYEKSNNDYAVTHYLAEEYVKMLKRNI